MPMNFQLNELCQKIIKEENKEDEMNAFRR